MHVTVSRIVATVCDYYGVIPSELKGRSRRHPIVRYRQIAGYLAKELTKQSYPEIGRRLGGRDHSTVIHSCEKVRDLIKRDPDMAKDVSHLIGILTAGTPCNDNEAPEVLPDLLALERERERERQQRIRELRLIRARRYLEKRRAREAARAIKTMSDDDYLSWKVSEYAKRDKVERFA